MNTSRIEQIFQQAITYHRAGKLAQAEQLYRRVLQQQPHHPDANHNLGVLAVSVNKIAVALPLFKAALEANPKQAQYWLSYLEALIQTNQLTLARSILVQSRKQGLTGEKVEKLAARMVEPTEVEIETLVNLFNQADYSQVETLAQDLIQRFPQHGFGWKTLGAVLPLLGRLEEALPIQLKSVELSPNDAEALYNLANTFKRLSRFDEAIRNYQLAIAFNPNRAEAYNNLALTLHELGHLTEAIKNYQHAIALIPNNAQFFYNLGITLQQLGQLDDAIKIYRLALRYNPNYAQAYNNLGNALKELGCLSEAEKCYCTSLAINPEYADVQSNLLCIYDYSNHYSFEFRLSAAKRYGEIVAKKVTQRYSHWQCELPATRLRIGLVSGDFRNHPVAYFLEHVLSQVDPQKIELFAYATFHQTDQNTERIKPYFSEWKTIFSLSDAAAAELIHQDALHILFDLSGHTAHSRLSLFAWKPAPIQICWLGYWATTGVAEMDYILADKVGVPEHSQHQFLEKVCYLPNTRFCFSAPKLEIPVSELPALTNGYITFACFQNLTKLTDPVLELWSKILAHVPSAKLRLQCKQFRDKNFTERLQLRLTEFGINPQQVSLHNPCNRAEYLAAYSEVDVILDTFPFTGGTTTCEALWMGVPTLTLAGESLLARQGASLLSAAGLEDWIADNPESYLEKAITFAADLDQLAKLRAKLRRQVLTSALFDAQRFAKNFETVLWQIWREQQFNN